MREIIQATANMEGLAYVLQCVEERCTQAGFSALQCKRINIIVDEIAGNIVKYAYSVNEGKMQVFMQFHKKYIKLCFMDCGIPYNPLIQEKPDINLPLENRSIGGLGIHMVRQLTHKMKYKRKNKKNYLFLWVKKN